MTNIEFINTKIEIIEEQISEIKEKIEVLGKDAIMKKSLSADLRTLEMHLNTYESIKKDLEVLKIIMPYVGAYYDSVNEEYILKIGFEERIPESEDYNFNYSYINIEEDQYNLINEVKDNEQNS